MDFKVIDSKESKDQSVEINFWKTHRTMLVFVYLKPTEYFRIKKTAESLGLSMSAFGRSALLEKCNINKIKDGK